MARGRGGAHPAANFFWPRLPGFLSLTAAPTFTPHPVHPVLPPAAFIRSVDYSSVKVKLLTSSHLFKSETNCSPKGYFFMPIYDKVHPAQQPPPPPPPSFRLWPCVFMPLMCSHTA